MLKDVLETLPQLTPGKRVVSVLSGGLDSTIVTYTLVEKYGKDNVVALSFNYGQKQTIELDKAKLTCQKLGIGHHIIDISFLGKVVEKVSALSATGDVVSAPRTRAPTQPTSSARFLSSRSTVSQSTALASGRWRSLTSSVGMK